MMKKNRSHRLSKRLAPLVMFILLAALAFTVGAAEAITPDIGVPLRDAAVTRAPDGTYYLTGTTPGIYEGRSPDFNNNRGVRVWSSRDLKSWTDLGLVWDLHKDPSKNPHGHTGSAWQTELYPWPEMKPGKRARGMTAPKLAHDGERFWITFSMNGYAAGAMPGGAKVEDRFFDTRLIVETGGAPTGKSDASLFVDKDGTHYLLWGGGCLAKLKSPDELKKLQTHETGVAGETHYLPALAKGFTEGDDLPERGAPYGCFLFHDGDRYHFLFAASTLRNGKIHEDSYICHAEYLLGPYSQPEILRFDSGRCSLFQDSNGNLLVSYSDPENRPVIDRFSETSEIFSKIGKPFESSIEIATKLPAPLRKEITRVVPQLMEMIEPCLDHPLRDGALCRGPKGVWYLTGTEAAQRPDGTLDWSVNKGVHLWKSNDLKTWDDLGYVWDMERDAPKSPGSQWQIQTHLDTTCGASLRVGRAMTAPEMHYLKDTFWIVYSMNGCGIGLLKSKTGEAQGPYEDMGRLVANGRDPSLFEDDDQVYLVWGQGFCAKMKDDMTGLDGSVRTLFTRVDWKPRYMRRYELMGQWGSRLVKQGDWYIWTFASRTGRCGVNAIDSMACWSKSLDGPWCEPCVMLPNGGQSTLIEDGQGAWLATVSGEDELSECPFQPAITTVVSAGKASRPLSLKPFRSKSLTADFQAINNFKATSLNLWKGRPDLIPHTLRDVFIMRDNDGAYYCTGSFWGVEELRRHSVLFKSTNLLNWTQLPPHYSYVDLKKDGLIKDAEAFEKLVEEDKKGENWRFRIQIGEQNIWRLDGDYYMNVQAFCRPGGHYLIKSMSGKIEGPWKGIQQIVGVGDLMQDDDGAILFTSGGWIRRFENVKVFEESNQSEYRKNRITIENKDIPNICFSEDCEAGLVKIQGKYVNWSTDWTGSYDAIYQVADDYKGPYGGSMRILPYGGNGKFFQDEKGVWFYAYFPNSNDYATRSQNHTRMNMYPLFTGFEDGELVIEPKAQRENRIRIEKMGALWHTPTGQ